MKEMKSERLVKIDESTYLIPITVLTGDVLQQLEDRFIFDAESLETPKSCALDYNHDDAEIIGRVEEFKRDPATGEITAVAALVARPDLPAARVNEVLSNLKASVPYEVSPLVDLYAAAAEELGDGKTAIVNGREVAGPLSIYRRARVRGVAICPHGADANTAFVAFHAKTTVRPSLSLNYGVQSMNDEEDKTKPSPEPIPESDDRQIDPELVELINEFGKERGLDYYLEGFTVDEARADDYAQLKALRETPAPSAVEPTPKPDPVAALSARVEELNQKILALSARRGDRYGLAPSPEQRPEPTDPEKKRAPLFAAAEKFRRAGTVRK